MRTGQGSSKAAATTARSSFGGNHRDDFAPGGRAQQSFGAGVYSAPPP